jgi:hypothetical protein
MIEDVLLRIEGGVPAEAREALSKKTASGWYQLYNLSKSLRELANTNPEIREILFKNNENSLHYAGDILSASLFEYWVAGGSLGEIFIKHAKNTYDYAGVDFNWD